MPTPSKGDRVAVTARIPADHFKKLERVRLARGISKQDFAAAAVVAALDDIDIDEVEQAQERLPISA